MAGTGQPALIGAGDRSVPVTLQTRSSLPPDAAFALIVPIDLSLVFTGWGPFPAVRGIRNQTGDWDHVGASRNPDLSDDSTATELLTEYTPGHSFAYELTGFTKALRHVVAGVRGEWSFAPDRAGSLIRWTYEFRARPGRGRLVRFAIVPLWRRYLRAGLDAAARTAERMAEPAAPPVQNRPTP